jgi:hypothetical protein
MVQRACVHGEIATAARLGFEEIGHLEPDALVRCDLGIVGRIIY